MPEYMYDFNPNVNQAYWKDSAGNEYFGIAPRGSELADAKWMIIKLEVTSGSGGTGWNMKWADSNDLPDNVWGSPAAVESLTYGLLARR